MWKRTNKHFGEVLPGSYGLAVFEYIGGSKIAALVTSCGCTIAKTDGNKVIALIGFGNLDEDQEYKIKVVTLKVHLEDGTESELKLEAKVCRYGETGTHTGSQF